LDAYVKEIILLSYIKFWHKAPQKTKYTTCHPFSLHFWQLKPHIKPKMALSIPFNLETHDKVKPQLGIRMTTNVW